MKTCFACHEKAKVSDLVFTHDAPLKRKMFIWLIRLMATANAKKLELPGVLLEHFVSRVALVA
jgi:hypothetical protein